MRLYIIIVTTVLVLDQLTKLWVVSVLDLYDSRVVISGFFNLVHVINKGAAFSLLASVDSPLRHYFFVGVNSAAGIILTVAAYRMRRQHLLYLLAFALICGGAVGNLIDRVRVGAVIDFLDFYFGSYHWPAFNVADSSICVGVALLFIANLAEPTNQERSSR